MVDVPCDVWPRSCVRSDQQSSWMRRGAKDEMYPFLTPSIWRSIHQTPGTLSMSHNEAFLPKDPIGSHCKTKK